MNGKQQATALELEGSLGYGLQAISLHAAMPPFGLSGVPLRGGLSHRL